MMKFLLLLLLALGASATASKVDRKLVKPEDIQSIKDKGQAHLSRMTQSDPEACITAYSAIYNETAIAPTEYFTLLMSFVWTDPSFDMKSYFDSVDFDAQCAALGGEVYQPEIEFKCEEGTTTWTEFKFCQPAVCEDVEFVWTMEFLVGYSSELTGCEMSLIDDTVPSFECIMGIQEIYGNGTALADVAPEGALTPEGIEGIEGLGSCRQFGEGGFDIGVCQMTDLKEEYEFITNVCENAYGGEIVPFDITLTVPYYHRTLRRYPVCISPKCEFDEALLYYAYIVAQYEESALNYYQFVADIGFDVATMNTCDETPRDKAFMKKYNGNLAVKSCKWLQRRPEELKTKYCSKTVGQGGFMPASEVCPSTCCACEEDDDNVFLKKMALAEDGTMKIQTKTCGWLKTLSQDKIDFQCGKKAASFVGGFPPASAACPGTCGCDE